MEVISGRRAWQDMMASWSRSGSRVGLCPTMGAIHAGHLSLVRHSQAQCDRTVVSIFVNPTQFTLARDLETYPRPLKEDLALLQTAGVDAVFVPEVHEIYPAYPEVSDVVLSVGRLGESFEGRDRPGHFSAVATVVSILLNLTQADSVFFGEKDFQQLCVVKAVIRDLGMATQVVAVPTIRESDGLAMSSRNGRLSGEGRREALVIARALGDAQACARSGGHALSVRSAMHERLATCTAFSLSYAELVDINTFSPVPPETTKGTYRAVIAGVIEGVRLLDNAAVSFPSS